VTPAGHCVDDYILAREDSAFEAEFHFSEVTGLAAQVDYKITGSATRDRPFIGVVVGQGPGKPCAPSGAVWIEELRELLSDRAYAQAMAQFGKYDSPPAFALDQLIITNLSSISYRVPYLPGHYLLRGPVVMATIERKEKRVMPKQHWILVRSASEARIQRAISSGPIILPTHELATDDVEKKRATGIVAAYGEVLDRGPGRWTEGRWEEPPCQEGDLILYDESYATLPITVRGERRTLVASSQVCHVLESNAALPGMRKTGTEHVHGRGA
jgi:hypothetical protein